MVSEFGQVLLRVLDDKDLSCYELGEASALGAVTISRLVNGRREPNERHVLRILIPLFVSPADLDSVNELLSIADANTFIKPRRKKRAG